MRKANIRTWKIGGKEESKNIVIKEFIIDSW